MNGDLERRILADLARLRREAPFSVDVTARVMAEVRRIGPPPQAAIASRQVVVWAAAAAVLAAAGLALLLLVPGLAAGPDVAARAGGLAATVAGWLAGLPGAAARGMARTVDVLASFRGVAAVLAPVVAAVLAAALAGMAAITAYVVGRDLRQGRSLEAR